MSEANNNNNNNGQPAAPPAEDEVEVLQNPLPSSIATVWDHPLVESSSEPLTNGLAKAKKYWKCLAPGCGKKWSGLNTTKALAHCSRDHKYCLEVHIKPCTGRATEEEIRLFAGLLKTIQSRKSATKRAVDLVKDSIESTQAEVSASVSDRKKPRVSGGFASANSALSTNSTLSTKSASSLGGRQLDVVTALDKHTVDGCNAADLDTAIAQLVYCKALPFSFGECPYFQRVLEVARSAPRGYQPPKRNILSGPMLDISYAAQQKRDLEELMVDSDVFGLAFLEMVPLFTSVP